MADPLSIVASVIGVVTAAVQVTQALHDFIGGIRDAPQNLYDTSDHLKALTDILDKFEVELRKHNETPGSLSTLLSQAKPTIEACQTACNEFHAWLKRATRHSDASHISWRDRIGLQYEDKTINAFKSRLQSYESTINLALGFTSLNLMSQNAGDLRSIGDTATKTLETVTSQIQGLSIGMQAVIEFEAEKNELMSALEEQTKMLTQCARVCMPVLEAATKTEGNTVRYAVALGEARQLVGVIGDVKAGGAAVAIDQLIAKDKARQMGGTISGDVALAFMK
ncbi:hypothetical protein COL26b_006297 [Colletotrichum chrysophilum]|uniref:Azaphilone pigments biosynthesis cluster protein L N-terminal domain-containing protein n=1 Tax=Colletotrichum chrysophilum TaxID=1836956 RepID=A0AAD9A0K6_9PEZI|nr:uncharacterized protein COL26b_006297 [Colletotrichum chrysophilum]KAJ0375418.1 hypothetical protein COL26b_006297 [Colletotrichum chrysophilum]KAK1839196.1 hypothetical protein CCHR01_18176 [Colletotrichum chrysophilum]